MKVLNTLKKILVGSILAASSTAYAAEQVGFDITPTEFNHRLEVAAKAVGAPKSTTKPGPIVEGKYNSSYKWQYAPRYELIGYVNKTSGQLSAVQLLTKGDGSLQSGVDVIALASALVMAANGDDDQKEAKSIVLSLLEKLKNRKDKFMEITVDDGRFMYSVDQEMAAGTWFSIEDSEE